MGTCGSSEDKKKRNRRATNKKENATLQKADLNSSQTISRNKVDKRIEILQRGDSAELAKMINEYEEDINEYSFGQNKTLLIQAVISCNNKDVIGYIMNKGANINLAEAQTGNTALFLAALDLKVDFVKELLEFNPRMDIRNRSKMDIFEFLDYQLIQQRKKINRELSRMEKKKYAEIIGLLKEA
ncbi:MAG: ankyrin repeat domain-containing protein, partial [archaeon]|nr:ankyrin repeat domain-containing protein [archaeon]